jgi:hypothetical protein
VSFVYDVLHNVFLAPINGDWGLGDVCRAQVGKRLLLFSFKGFDFRGVEYWEECGLCVGRLSVTVECFSSVAVILSGPSKQGMNLATFIT